MYTPEGDQFAKNLLKDLGNKMLALYSNNDGPRLSRKVALIESFWAGLFPLARTEPCPFEEIRDSAVVESISFVVIKLADRLGLTSNTCLAIQEEEFWRYTTASK